MSDGVPKELERGLIGWMTSNRVTPNLMMIVLLIGGFFYALRIKQEVFPEFDLDIVIVSVPYPGSSPEEVEQGIVLAVEEAIRGLEGIKEVTATASEGMGMVSAELLEGVDRQRVYQEIKQEVDRITTFPQDAERPEVRLIARRREVVQFQIYGEASEWVLRELAEQVRDGLLQTDGITQVDLAGVRDFEVQVLVSQDTLRTYGLTMQEVANRIRTAAIELPGGHIETQGGEILLRVMERRDWANEFAGIPIVTTPAGTVLSLGDIATVVDDFKDVDRMATFNGMRAVGISVYRIGDQTPIGVSDATRRAMSRIEEQLPPGIEWGITQDRADIYRQRLSLLLKNACWGLLLVLLLLAVFLEFKLAVWVTMGIPISFLGSFLFLPAMDVTINMISMFAFIIALGIVVDDAIVVGENIYEYRNRGMSFLEASIQGARDVAMPVTFSILTNVAAFLPLYFIPGFMGKVWKVVPVVVITVFMISLVESLLILPTHLAFQHQHSRNRPAAFLHDCQQRFSRRYERFIEGVFAPFLDFCISYRHITLATGAAILLTVLSTVFSGRIGMILMPRIESDYASVRASLPFGSPQLKVQEVANLLVEHAKAIVAENGGDTLSKGIFAVIDEDNIDVRIFLTDSDVRPVSTTRVTQLWRERTGPLAGLESLMFEADRGGPGSGAALTIELNHRDIDVLDSASSRLAEILADFPNVKDIDDGFTPGKEQLNYTIRSEGQSLGLTAQEVARQVRNAFFGAEALRQQRGRNEIRVRVKYPKAQRISEYDVEQLLIRTPAGTDVPLLQVADVSRGRSYTTITRRDGRRTVMVTANVEPIDESSQVIETVKSDILPQLVKDYPGLGFGWEGQQADMRDSMQSLINGFLFALAVIYAMLAIPFRSYIQPLIVMIAIPFGIVGAVLGHQIMGYSLSVMSMMGIVALSGVVVNDSLVLIDYANRLRANEGLSAFEAIHRAGVRRFRPIMLTTLTTFGGLAPMIFETSRQARFMIPMALSLGFGILFATLVTLVIVPCLYMMLHEAGTLHKRFEAFMDS
jgi:multidrug efflux pump subunit AcrB